MMIVDLVSSDETTINLATISFLAAEVFSQGDSFPKSVIV
jgi:hypothetical protein